MKTAFKARLLLSFCIPALLVGCALGGPYIPSERLSEIAKLSDEQILNHPVQADALLSQNQVASLVPYSLSWSVGRALADSPIVRQAYYGLSGTSLSIQEAQSLRGPNIGLDGQYGATDSSGNELTRSTHVLGINATWTLFDGGVGALKTDKARWQVMGALASVAERVESVAQSVAEAYIGVLKAKDILKINKRQVSDMETLLNEVKRLAAAGATNASDVPEAEARTDLFRERVILSTQQLADAKARLFRFTGQTVDENQMERPEDAITGSENEKQILSQIPEHPSIKIIDYEIQAAIKAVCAVDAERNGSIVLQLGTAGLASAFLGKSVVELGSAILNLTLPLIDSGNRDARLKHAAADLEVSLARRVDIERQIGYAVSQGVHARDAANAQSKIADQERTKDIKVAAIKRSDYKAGIVDLKSVLDAEQSKLDAEVKSVSASWDRTLSTYTLLGAQGILASKLHAINYRMVNVKGTDDPFPEPTLLKSQKGPLLSNVPVVP